MTSISKILRQQLAKTKPSEAEKRGIASAMRLLLAGLATKLKKARIKADVFVGGSVAKDTLIKKKKYDIDIFVRFDKKYGEQGISRLLAKSLPRTAARLHGSRDYFRIREPRKAIEFEIIPTIKIREPREAKNITDLSYFHVNYVRKKISRQPKLADEIRLAKAFAYYQECYGAESYINGFSGYALELLVIHYKSFVNFAKAMLKIRGKEIIDPERHYKNKKEAEEKMNSSKLESPIVLIDPTFKERNALAALSYHTFYRFQKSCARFLKNPSAKFFELQDRKAALEKKYGSRLAKIRLATPKQAGDIAGTKMKKFYMYFVKEAEKFFDVEKADFDYDEVKNAGTIFFVAKPKKQIIFSGPPEEMGDRLKEFRKKHKKIAFRYGRAYAIEKNSLDLAGFLKKFLKEKRKTMGEMGVSIKI